MIGPKGNAEMKGDAHLNRIEAEEEHCGGGEMPKGLSEGAQKSRRVTEERSSGAKAEISEFGDEARDQSQAYSHQTVAGSGDGKKGDGHDLGRGLRASEGRLPLDHTTDAATPEQIRTGRDVHIEGHSSSMQHHGTLGRGQKGETTGARGVMGHGEREPKAHGVMGRSDSY